MRELDCLKYLLTLSCVVDSSSVPLYAVHSKMTIQLRIDVFELLQLHYYIYEQLPPATPQFEKKSISERGL